MPVEIRLIIYEFSSEDIYLSKAFQDMILRDRAFKDEIFKYKAIKNKVSFSNRSSQRRRTLEIHFNILLVNREMYLEARKIAYNGHLAQVRRCHHAYYVCQTTFRDTPRSRPKRQWHLGIQKPFSPRCRSVEALACLKLPRLALAISLPQDDRHFDQLRALKTFFRDLARALKAMNATKSLEIHFPPYAKIRELARMRVFIEPLEQITEMCLITITTNNIQYSHSTGASLMQGCSDTSDHSDGCDPWEVPGPFTGPSVRREGWRNFEQKVIAEDILQDLTRLELKTVGLKEQGLFKGRRP